MYAKLQNIIFPGAELKDYEELYYRGTAPIIQELPAREAAANGVPEGTLAVAMPAYSSISLTHTLMFATSIPGKNIQAQKT